MLIILGWFSYFLNEFLTVMLYSKGFSFMSGGVPDDFSTIFI